MRRRIAIWVFVGCLVGCSESGKGGDDGESGGKGQSGNAGEAGAGNSGAGGSSGTSGGASGSGGTGGTSGDGAGGEGGDAGTGGSATGGTGGGELVPLPPGSREVGGVVNLVDAAAAEELETFLTVQEPVFVTRRQDMTVSFNLFVDHYLEEYDFVFFYPDHTVENAYAVGIFQALNSRAEPGGTSEFEIALGGYKTDGRTKGVVGMNYDVGFYGPMAHEMMHFWGADLDARFGFGLGLGEDYGPHWGHSSVNGQLGGFDGSTLRCETPANAMPPCTPLASGRTRYVVGDYAPFTNTYRNVPYSPLELYLMGMAPESEVPATFQVLVDAEIVTPELQGMGGTVVVEAAGIDTVTFAEIRARHGQKRALAEADRAFRAAFVVLSATPASDAVMEDVARIAAVYGGRQTQEGWASFDTIASGRATLDTELGARREVSAAPPPVRELFECDVVAQDCGRPELGCHFWPPSFCALNGDVALDEPCDAAFACAPGLECVAGVNAPTVYVCKPYCDPTSTTSADSCQMLCPNTYEEYVSAGGNVGLCFPG